MPKKLRASNSSSLSGLCTRPPTIASVRPPASSRVPYELAIRAQAIAVATRINRSLSHHSGDSSRVPTTATSVATDTLIANCQELLVAVRFDSSQIDSRSATTYSGTACVRSTDDNERSTCVRFETTGRPASENDDHAHGSTMTLATPASTPPRPIQA